MKSRWDFLVPSSVVSWKSPVIRDTTTSLGRLFQWLIVLTVTKSLSYVEMKYLLMQLAPIASYPLHVGSWEETISILPIATLYILETVMRSPWAFSSPGLEDLTPADFPHRAGSPALWSSLWLSFWPSLVCLDLGWIVGTRTGHSTPGVAWQGLSRVGSSHVYIC